MFDFLTKLGIYKILKSKRFTVAVITTIVYALGIQIPFVQEFSVEVTALAIGLVGFLVSGYSLEDAARAGREAQKPESLEAGVREIIDAVLEAKFNAASLTVDEVEHLEVG